MNLPKVVQELIKAQDTFDSVAYANCFSETGVMYDEGKTHSGKKEIQQWIAKGNAKYKTVMRPLAFAETGNESILSSEISGTFDGSPVTLKFHFEIMEGLIQSLKVTG
jgi:hypothetical protein